MIIKFVSKNKIVLLTLIIVSIACYFNNYDQNPLVLIGFALLMWISIFFANSCAYYFQAPSKNKNIAAFMLAFFSFNIYPDLKTLLFSLILIFVFCQTINFINYPKQFNKNKIFNLSLFFAFVSSFYPSMIVFILLLVYTFKEKIQNIVLVLFAYVIAIYLFFMTNIFIFHNNFISTLHKFIVWTNENANFFFSYYWFFVIIIFLSSLFYIIIKAPNEIKGRQTLWTTILFTFLGIINNTFISYKATIITLFGLSLILSYFFYTVKTKWWLKDLIFILILTLNLVFAFKVI